jgi:hypothetical protein
MSFFCLSIEDIAACSMNFISTFPCFKSSGLRSATVAYWINENEVFVKQTSDPKVNSKNMHGLVSTKKSKLPFGEQLVSLCINIEQPEYLHSTSCKEGFDFSCFACPRRSLY